MGVEHGFGARLFWLGLFVVLVFLALGTPIQIDELLDEDVGIVTGELVTAMIPIRDFLMMDTDVSRVVRTSSSSDAAKLTVSVTFNRDTIISRMVD